MDVQDYGGRGENEPNPFFYQNLGEVRKKQKHTDNIKYVLKSKQ